MRRPGRDDNLTFVESLKRQWLETIDALPDPFLVVGKDYKVHKANAVLAGLANSDIKSVVGRPCYEVFARRNSPCENCGMQSVSNSAQPKLYEIQNSHNGRNYEVVAKYFHSQDDQSEGVLQIYRDRTETIRLQHQ